MTIGNRCIPSEDRVTATHLQVDESTLPSDKQGRPTRPHDAGSSIRRVWSAPVNEARWCGTRPRPSPLVMISPLAALIAAYLSAVCASRGSISAAGRLLNTAVLAIVAGAIAVAVRLRRVVRYRAEPPYGESR